MPRTGRQLTRGMNVRITPEQDAAITARMTQRGISASDALRELLDLGISLAQAGTAGTVMTQAARRLLADGHASRLVHVTLEDSDQADELAAALDLGPDERDVAAAGGLVWMTAEERAAL
jgi:hypothetical protein